MKFKTLARYFKRLTFNRKLNDHSKTVEETPRLVVSFDLPSGKKYTCAEDCENCYSMREEKVFKTCLRKRLANLRDAKNGLKETIAEIEKLQAMFPEKEIVIRIHAAGDFFSQKYVEAWKKITVKFSDISFYGYSKREFDFSALKKSAVIHANKCVNFGDEKMIGKLLGTGDYFLCPCTKENALTGICSKCGKCYSGKEKRFPCFLKH